MSKPTTEAGRALWGGHSGSHYIYAEDIVAIEAEARAAVLADLRAKVEALGFLASDAFFERRDGDLIELLRKRDVLALLDPK